MMLLKCPTPQFLETLQRCLFGMHYCDEAILPNA